MRRVLPLLAVLALLAVTVAGCSKKSPTSPTPLAPDLRTASATAASQSARPAPGKPGYEPAYVNGTTVMINAIEYPGKTALKAQADFYEVVYPTNWQAEGIPAPLCAPCDHDGNGIDPLDYHDHVLDSQPGDVGFRAPWHVFVVVPAYNGNAGHDAAIDALYQQHLPLMSESAMDAFLAIHLEDGSPVAVEIDTHFFFLCAVVGAGTVK